MPNKLIERNEMREIKFQLVLEDKVIDIDRIEWRKGKPYRAGYYDKEFDKTTWFYFGTKLGYTLRESTGLTDKNGGAIYEGDMFSAWDNRSYYAVEWNEKSTGFHLVWVKGAIGDSKNYHYFDMLMAEYQFEPVGNIYENKDLLEPTHA